jgi:SAM-dependent methyltransferase
MGSSQGTILEVTDYWNHNSAYHSWILKRAASHHGDSLDVGCGEGLLLQRLAPRFRTVTGIELHEQSAIRAHRRVAALANVTVECASFEEFDPDDARFDVITFVASIHHMDLSPALQKALFLLAPGGELLVVGLAANKSVVDWALSAIAWPFAYAGSRLHRETRNIGVPVAEPRQCLSEISATAREVLPDVSIRRALYYRYLLHCGKPV